MKAPLIFSVYLINPGKAILARVWDPSPPASSSGFWQTIRSFSKRRNATTVLRSAVDSNSLPPARRQQPEAGSRFIIPRSMTEQLKKKLQDEIATLEHELSYELPKELKKAVALGDLSENAEYHMAKQRQEFVKARIRQLGRRLADLSLINMNNIPKDKVGLGSTVKVYDSGKEEEIEYKLVTSEETDVATGKISTTSPIGRALLNKKVGDTATVVTPNGKREMEILKLITAFDEAGAQAE
jgi:transcription elongation factor GreA